MLLARRPCSKTGSNLSPMVPHYVAFWVRFWVLLRELLPMLLHLMPGHVRRLCISWTGLTSKSSSSRRRSGVCTSLLWSDTE